MRFQKGVTHCTLHGCCYQPLKLTDIFYKQILKFLSAYPPIIEFRQIDLISLLAHCCSLCWVLVPASIFLSDQVFQGSQPFSTNSKYSWILIYTRELFPHQCRTGNYLHIISWKCCINVDGLFMNIGE